MRTPPLYICVSVCVDSREERDRQRKREERCKEIEKREIKREGD